MADAEPSNDFDHLYAVKRVERVLHDRTRELIRALARASGRRMRLSPPFAARRFVALTFADDVLTDPDLLPAWVATFGGDDDVTLALHVADNEAGRMPEVIAAAERAGADAPGAPDVTVVSTRGGSFEEAALRWAVHALYRPAGIPAPPLHDDVPLLSPQNAGDLRALAERWLAATAPSGS
jgi:hypothetical protein